jgi:hypothetical protein
VKSKAFHWEIKDLLIQFLSAFDNVIIKRFNAQRTPGATQQVRYIYAPKQRVLFDLINPGQNLTLPVISVTIGSISRDVNRVFNKNAGFFPHATDELTNPSALTYFYRTPVPVNIEVKMSILTRYQSDMDQILSNFVPYNNPYVIISWTVPKDYNLPYTQEIRTEVLWGGQINLSYPTDINGNQKAQIIADTSFTIKGFLFPAAEDPVNNIFKIDTTFTSVSTETNLASINFSNLLEQTINMNSPLSSFVNSETVTVSARPKITAIAIKSDLGYYEAPQTVFNIITGQSKDFVVYGDMFRFSTQNGLFVSSNRPAGMSYYNLYSSTRSISSQNPPFSAFTVSDYTIVNNNIIYFNLSSFNTPQKLDIIVANDAGYQVASSIKSFDHINIITS